MKRLMYFMGWVGRHMKRLMCLMGWVGRHMKRLMCFMSHLPSPRFMSDFTGHRCGRTPRSVSLFIIFIIIITTLIITERRIGPIRRSGGAGAGPSPVARVRAGTRRRHAPGTPAKLTQVPSCRPDTLQRPPRRRGGRCNVSGRQLGTWVSFAGVPGACRRRVPARTRATGLGPAPAPPDLRIGPILRSVIISVVIMIIKIINRETERGVRPHRWPVKSDMKRGDGRWDMKHMRRFMCLPTHPIKHMRRFMCLPTHPMKYMRRFMCLPTYPMKHMRRFMCPPTQEAHEALHVRFSFIFHGHEARRSQCKIVRGRG